MPRICILLETTHTWQAFINALGPAARQAAAARGDAKLQQHAAMVAGMSGPRALLHASFIAYGLLLVYRDAPSSAKPAAVREETATQPTKQQQQARVLNTAAAHVVVQICNA